MRWPAELWIVVYCSLTRRWSNRLALLCLALPTVKLPAVTLEYWLRRRKIPAWIARLSYWRIRVWRVHGFLTTRFPPWHMRHHDLSAMAGGSM